MPFSEFRIFSRGIVQPYRTTPGPTSEFNYLSSAVRQKGRNAYFDC
ncbi:hypothetical protein D1AOALGA4SA_3978 [Olavius algarvensis Delta 1 endosymbiont]|nr:hypothetical protein D1AOALGA4SA_3978 [Olavius algarvensis Delta 1 endosymbiont]